MEKLHISNRNSKLGAIPNISLAPGATCSAAACKTCLKEGCYAMKAYRQYAQTRVAWDDNTDLAQHDLPRMESELNKYFGKMTAPRFFRIHVAGDFFSAEYAQMWARVAANNPGTRFLAFTKQWDNVRGVDFPENFSLVLSAWPGTEIPADLTARYSAAYVDDGNTEIPRDALPCPGKCETCGACWGLATRHIDVVFNKH